MNTSGKKGNYQVVAAAAGAAVAAGAIAVAGVL